MSPAKYQNRYGARTGAFLSALPEPLGSREPAPWATGRPNGSRFHRKADQEGVTISGHPQKETPVLGELSLMLHATDFPHLIDTTARPRTPHPRHRTRSVRSSTLRLVFSPSRARNAGVSNAVCPQAAQSTLTKSPGPRSSILAAYSGTISSPDVLHSFRSGESYEPGRIVNRQTGPISYQEVVADDQGRYAGRNYGGSPVKRTRSRANRCGGPENRPKSRQAGR
jgi:hypothetical protein